MIRFWLIMVCLCSALPANSDTVVATRTIRALEILTADDVTLVEGKTQGSAQLVEQVVGLEARRVLYAGRPISLSDLGAPAVVERNGLVKLGYRLNGLLIMTEGRALSRGGFGERVRVINMRSKKTVTGTIGGDGVVWVSE